MNRPPPRRPGRLPARKATELARARRLEWLTLGLRIGVVAALYATLGGVQALTAIWLKSLWALLPPAAFLIACRIEARQPTPRFPFGFYRAASIAFLTAALALTCMGLYLIAKGLRGLAAAKQPGLADFAHAGPLLDWAGWPMIAALAFSIAVPQALGRRRQKLAVALHDKGLYADAAMGRVNWLAGGAAIIGILGIGAGLWWADFAATLFIGGDILRHGARHLYTAVCDLIDEVPRRLGTATVDPLGRRIREYLESLPWVDSARVRLREEGRLLTGIALVCPNTGEHLLDRFETARAQIERMDWRLLDFHLVPVCRATYDRICAEQSEAPSG